MIMGFELHQHKNQAVKNESTFQVSLFWAANYQKNHIQISLFFTVQFSIHLLLCIGSSINLFGPYLKSSLNSFHDFSFFAGGLWVGEVGLIIFSSDFIKKFQVERSREMNRVHGYGGWVERKQNWEHVLEV